MGLVAVDAEERFEPERIVDALNRGGVRYVTVGGLAAGTHGVVRATRDLDLVPTRRGRTWAAWHGCSATLADNTQSPTS